jgi:hypothetical protein
MLGVRQPHPGTPMPREASISLCDPGSPCASAPIGGRDCGGGVDRPKEELTAKVNFRLMSRRAGFFASVAAALAFGRIRATLDRTAGGQGRQIQLGLLQCPSRTLAMSGSRRRAIGVNPVHLECLLGQVQTDRANLLHGTASVRWAARRSNFGTTIPQGGRPTPSSPGMTEQPIRSVGRDSRRSVDGVRGEDVW